MSLLTTDGVRYGALDSEGPEPPPTYQDVAKDWGVCWQRVRQIEHRALKKIRAAVEAEAERAGVSPAEWLRGE